MGRIIGIDLGTTNSVAAYWSKRRPRPVFNARYQSPSFPSMVAIEHGKRLVGQDARDRQLSGSQNVVYSIKRFIGRDYEDENVQKALRRIGFPTRKAENGEVEVGLGDHYYSPVEISAMILAELKKAAEEELGEAVTHAVITVPAYFGQRQKNATREAGSLAGLKVLRVINEPTAAVLAFGISENAQTERFAETQHVLVYDLGGGTLDISILLVADGNYEVLHIDGDNFLGGDNFDDLIVDDILLALHNQYGVDLGDDFRVRNRLKRLAEQAKIELGRNAETRILAPVLVQMAGSPPINLDYTLTRLRFEELIGSMVQRSMEITRRALQNANLKPEDINRVLLVGGSTRIPLVRTALRDLFDERIATDVDPMYCVALGAAIQTTLPIDWLCPHCNTVNEGTEDACRHCKAPHSDEEPPNLVCDQCGKPNPQGRTLCWNCNTPLGAVITENILNKGQKETEEHRSIRIRDVTSKYIGVGVEAHQAGDEHSLRVVIPKGTLYPTDEVFRVELYTNRLGQESYLLPVFEYELEMPQNPGLEHIGLIENHRLPPGLPKDTPVIVEMHIDGDGILTVSSYIKKRQDETFVEKSFRFGGEDAFREGHLAHALRWVDFYVSYLEIISQDQALRRYLKEDQADQAQRLIAIARPILKSENLADITPLKQRLDDFVRSLPTPTEEVFWAYWAIDQPQISATERNQVREVIQELDNALVQNDIDAIDLHLDHLRQHIRQMLEKIPTSLLRSMRSN